MKEKYLPIGTVVLLKEGTKKVMITSYMIFSAGENEEKKMFDYGGCPFPEGIIESNYAVGFNHDQIDKVVHLGLIDNDQMQFNTLLNQTTAEIHQKFAEEFGNK